MGKRLLTARKAAAIRARRPAMVRGLPLNPPAATGAKYAAKLERLVEEMATITKAEVAVFFGRPAVAKHFGQDESTAHAAGRLVSALERRFAQLFDSRAQGLADWLVGSVDKASSSALHASLRELSGGLSMKTTVLTGPLKETLTAATAQNASLIKSIPAQYLHDVAQAVLRSVTTGNGLADLQPKLEERAEITKRRARMIAEDQTRKTYTAINRQRMSKLGLGKFEWLHSGGGKHPRELHMGYNGQVFDMDKPPVIDERTGETGFPGDAPNCRCKMIPVVSPDEVPA